MLLQDKQTGELIEILDIVTLVNPVETKIKGSLQAGEEEQPPKRSLKTDWFFLLAKIYRVAGSMPIIGQAFDLIKIYSFCI